MSNFTIRNATAKDWTSIGRIYNEAVTKTTGTFDKKKLNQKQISEKLIHYKKNRHILIVAETNKKRVVAWAGSSSWSNREGYRNLAELSVYVETQCHGLGIGHSLAQTVIRMLQKKGFHTILAFITRGNTASIKLFKKLEFVLNGCIKEAGEKFSRRHDLFIYQKMLKPRKRKR